MRSEGSRLLGAVDMKQRQIASRIGVNCATVARWISGERIPNEAHRIALHAAFRIPIEAWPDEWALVRSVVVRTLADKAPDLLAEIVEELERAGAFLK